MNDTEKEDMQHNAGSESNPRPLLEELTCSRAPRLRGSEAPELRGSDLQLQLSRHPLPQPVPREQRRGESRGVWRPGSGLDGMTGAHAQSAADQLCPENDEDGWFSCVWLTRRRRLMYFSLSAAWKRSFVREKMD
ncbi:unnamed protein product [Pleuronectes platessa]|uniref:Uncharacterized protein n=1 Tax=Pleuronectes platessa TaxID=8262 RepID=A0A9N7YNQ9_PLEPL|nr:unnamed protein product [Pleuronectes platessa]